MLRIDGRTMMKSTFNPEVGSHHELRRLIFRVHKTERLSGPFDLHQHIRSISHSTPSHPSLSIPIYPHDSVVTLALPLVTLTPSAFAFARISTRFRDDTACAISAAYVRLCMRSRSTSLGLWTRKALWPEGIMWRVILFEPNPI
jgi:hypothetical protein